MTNYQKDASFPTEKAGKVCEGMQWLRPWQIVDNPSLLDPDQAVESLVLQGRLQNCWFAASIIRLQAIKRVFNIVVPSQQVLSPNCGAAYTGSVKFRFWYYFKWIEVIIDDRLPTLSGQLVFMQKFKSSHILGRSYRESLCQASWIVRHT